jgi:NAD(P)H:quinone oxidoreductase, type IV
MKVVVIFYSAYGHIYKMAQAVAEGVKEVDGAQVELKRVAELLDQSILEKTGIAQAQKAFSHIPLATLDDLEKADAIIIGTPTRFGNMCAQMRAFWDSTGSLWMKGTLVGKVGSVFTSSATQHGGQETTILSTHNTLLHHGMIIVGLPYTFQGQMRIDEITGSSPYGASTIAGSRGELQPTKEDLAIARILGERVAQITKKVRG